MVAKISSNNSLLGTLLYNKQKLEKGEAQFLFSENVYERADGSFSMQTTLKSFEPYLVANNKTEKPIFHVSLNPDPKDILSDEQYKELADKYMTDMGYQNQPYIVFKHTDIKRVHLHIVSARVDENGKKLDSNFENMRSMKICRQIEKDFNLHPAEKQENVQPYELATTKLNYKDGDVKKQVGNIAKTMLNYFHFQSLGEYNTLLEMFNVSMEEVRGTYNEKPYYGLLYSALDDNGKKVGTPLKASLYGKTIGYDTLQKHFEKSKETINTNRSRENLRPIIAKAMQKAQNPNHLKQLLKEENIGITLRTNDENRIYGVTFIDYNNKVVLNGSRLGKEFSANVLEEKFKDYPVKNVEQKTIEKYFSDVSQSIPLSEPTTQQELTSSNLGLLDFEQHGIDYEAENFAKQKEMEEKKKQKRRERGW